MARIRSGILGNIRGKVAGVVGGQWKDKNYLREYVKPAYTRTDLQADQRDAMKLCVLFCKALVGPVFNEYTDGFIKTMSGFNQFVKTNIDIFKTAPVYTNIKLTEGKLYFEGISTAELYYDPFKLKISFGVGVGNNGSGDDKIYACCYEKDSKLWYFADEEGVRGDASINITVPAALDYSKVTAYCWAIKKTGELVNMISNASAKTAIAA